MENLYNDGVNEAGVGIYKVVKNSGKGFSADSPKAINQKKVLTADMPDRNKIKVIREHEPHYIVYLDKDGNLRWLFGEHLNVRDEVAQRAIMEVRHAAATPKCLDVDHHDSWIKMLAHAISLVAEGNAAFAMEIVKRSDDFLERRAREKARVWMVESSVLTSIVIFTGCLLVFLFTENQHVAIAFIMTALGFGVIGAERVKQIETSLLKNKTTNGLFWQPIM
jgi:hypothetical protein